jgi:hypothetical protein
MDIDHDDLFIRYFPLSLYIFLILVWSRLCCKFCPLRVSNTLISSRPPPLERHRLVKEKYHTQRDAIIAGVELIPEEMSRLMSAYGLTPPELPIDGGLKIPKFFLLALRACLCWRRVVASMGT